jgi:hypothetical protein
MQRTRIHSKNLMKKSILLIALCLATTFVFSQRLMRQQSCTDELISRQVDSLKVIYAQQGYELLREASMTMESEYEIPVIMQLTQGTWYQFVFIGDISSRLYEVRMYDWTEKQVIFRQNKWGDVDGNIIVYSYVPKATEFHMVKPVQVNKKKKKGLCGYVMMFKRSNGNSGE